MNFVSQLEDCYRDLATEAKKRHPGVKEASERATVVLRHSQTQYVRRVRQANNSSTTTPATQHPTTQLFQSSELIHPFVLATNYPNASPAVLELSVRAMKVLLQAQAVVPTDAIHLIRVWIIQAQVLVRTWTPLPPPPLTTTVLRTAIRTPRGSPSNKNSAESTSNTTNTAAATDPDKKESTTTTTTTTTTATPSKASKRPSSTTNSSSAWSYFWGGSSSSTTASTTADTTSVAAAASSSTTADASSSSSAAVSTGRVSPSPGNSLSTSSSHTDLSQYPPPVASPAQLEKLALDYLSCLWLLLEQWHTHYPDQLTPVLWKQALGGFICLLLNPARDAPASLQQTATTTLGQALLLLFSSRNNAWTTLQQDTWEDLLRLARPFAPDEPITRPLQGAFAPCGYPIPEIATSVSAADSSSSSLKRPTPHPPNAVSALTWLTFLVSSVPPNAVAPSLRMAWEVWTTTTNRHDDTDHADDDEGDEASREPFLRHAVRVAQVVAPYTAAVVPVSVQTLQTSDDNDASSGGDDNDNDMRERLQALVSEGLLPPIGHATAACRSHPDFEDGYVVVVDTSSVPAVGEAVSGEATTSTTAALSSSSSTSTPATTAASSQPSTTGSGEGDGLPPSLSLTESFIAPSHLGLACLSLETLYQVWGDTKAANGLSPAARLLHALYTPSSTTSTTPATSSKTLTIQTTPVTTLLRTLMETLSDFATLCASCRPHMHQLVFYLQQRRFTDPSAAVSNPTTSTATTSTTATGGTPSASSSGVYSGDKAIGANRALVLTEIDQEWEREYPPSTQLGHALWVTLSLLLAILQASVESARYSQQQQNDGDSKPTPFIAADVFAPTLAVLQHYLKRFPGCEDLVRWSLQGFLALAHVCGQAYDEGGNHDMHRTLLASLSKLSLPARSKSSGSTTPSASSSLSSPLHSTTSASGNAPLASVFLEDPHVPTLFCLVRIVHDNYTKLGLEDWVVIVHTLEDLSVLPIASPRLSDEAYHSALALSDVFLRLAPFSTCLSVSSLLHLLQALTRVVQFVTMGLEASALAAPLVTTRMGKLASATSTSTSSSSSSTGESQSLSRQLFSIGYRALYGSSTSDMQDKTDKTDEEHARTHKIFYEDYRTDFLDRISRAQKSIRVESVGRIPFSLALVVDVAMANSFRYDECGDKISGLLSNLATTSPAVRPFLMEAISMLTVVHGTSSASSSPTPFHGPSRVAVEINPMHSQLLAVEPIAVAEGSKPTNKTPVGMQQSDLLAPLCETLQTTDSPAVALSALETLYSVLETTGHNYSMSVWEGVINSLELVSGDPTHASDADEDDVRAFLDRASPKWSECSQTAFSCLKLIVDDFLDEFPGGSSARMALLDCCSSFGKSRQDVNTSLTAIGMLWTIADQGSGSESIDGALANLVVLAADTRPEVRNAAVNTLFSYIVGRGSTFTVLQWENCFKQTIFAIYEAVSSKASGEDEGDTTAVQEVASQNKKTSRYKVSRHHSRDSEDKQWIVSQVTVLRGLIRVLRTFFSKLLETTDEKNLIPANPKAKTDNVPWFQDAWVQILDFAFEAAAQGGGRETLEFRGVGVELLVLCCQLSSKAGFQAAIGPARVGTNMEVVNGALRSVRQETRSSVPESARKELSPSCEKNRGNFFLEAFESLESYLDFVRKEVDSGTTIDDSQLQTLHRFCTGLASLYECCKDGEFRRDQSTRCLQFFANQGSSSATKPPKQGSVSKSIQPGHQSESKPSPTDHMSFPKSTHLESRFLKAVKSVLEFSSGGASVRYLNQSQRAALDLLQAMCTCGSGEAFEFLVELADVFFLIRKDSEDSDLTGVQKSEVLGSNAASAIQKLVGGEAVSDECKALVLYQVLNILISTMSTGVLVDRHVKRIKLDFRRLVSLFGIALEACAAMGKRAASTDSGQRILLDAVWNTIVESLSVMTTSIPIGLGMEKISRVMEVSEIAKQAAERTPVKFAPQLCFALVTSAKNALSVAEHHDSCSKNHTDSEITAKSRKYCDELVHLFSSCFRACCKLVPDDKDLISLALEVLKEAVSTQGTDDEKAYILDSTVVICEALETTENANAMFVAVFAQLCKLVSSSSSSERVRQAVGNALATPTVVGLLETTHERCSQAEERAIVAEKEVGILTVQLKTLEVENERMRKDMAVLEASTAM